MIYYAIRKKGTDEYLAEDSTWRLPQYTKTNPRLWIRKKWIENYMTIRKFRLNSDNEYEEYIAHDYSDDHEIVTFELVEIEEHRGGLI